MKLKINSKEYSCRARVQKEQRVDFIAVTPALDNDDLVGSIETYNDDGVLIALDLVGAYQRAYVVGAIITLTSEPVLADPELVEQYRSKAPRYDGTVEAVGSLTGDATASQTAAAEQLRRAMQMFAAALPEEQALEISSVYPAWQPNKTYAAGDIISYGVNSVGDPQLYKVVQEHASQDEWTPDATPALYDAFGLDESGYPVWTQPAGAHDAYSVGDIVNYNGTLYESLIDGNVWSPEAYPAGWEVYTEEPEQPDPEPEPEPEPEEPGEDYPEWVQPTGAHDAYNTGDIVSYKGVLYISLIDGNAYSPEAYPAGWEEYTSE